MLGLDPRQPIANPPRPSLEARTMPVWSEPSILLLIAEAIGLANGRAIRGRNGSGDAHG